MVRPSKPCSLASKIQAPQNFTREETQSCEQFVLLMLIHEFLLIYILHNTSNTSKHINVHNLTGPTHLAVNRKIWILRILRKPEGTQAGKLQNLSKNRWYKRSSNRCLLTALAQSWWDCSVGSKTWQETSCKKVNVWKVTKGDLQPEVISTPNLLRNRCGGRQATQWSKGQKCRLHGFQRYFGCGNHRGFFIFDTCTRWIKWMNINESNWINRHKKFVVRSFRFKNHILFRFLWQITQTRGVAREMSWPAARGLRRRVRVTFEIPEKATSPSSWRKRHVMFFHVFFMTNEKQTKWQTNQKQSLNWEQKNTFFSTDCCCFLFQSSQRPVRPFLW